MFASEPEKLLSLVKEYTSQHSSKPTILDVGCGYGRYLAPLTKAGFDVTGVEANESIVQKNKAQGLKCVTVKEFNQDDRIYDAVLLSHVVEHFSPEAAMHFIDSYASRVREGGYVFIATPLMSPYFYDDFDHVKPYNPVGVQMVFDRDLGAQVQYYAKNHLKLCNLWIRKSPLRAMFGRGMRVRSLLGQLLYFLSFTLISRKDGWIGVFQKQPQKK